MRIKSEKYGRKQSVLILCALFITHCPFCARKIAVDPRNPLMPLNDRRIRPKLVKLLMTSTYICAKAVIIDNVCLIVHLIVYLIFLVQYPFCSKKIADDP